MAIYNINNALSRRLFQIVSVFLAVIIFFNVFNIQQHIFDYRRTSAIITTSYAIALAGIVCVCVCVCVCVEAFSKNKD